MNFLHSVFSPAMEDSGVAEDANAEWPNNMISRHAIVDEAGLIRRQGDSAKTPISLEEVALCQRLAMEAMVVVGGLEVDMGSESSDAFQPFWLVATQEEPVAVKIDEAMVHARFGGTLFPPTSMTIEPLEESGLWWKDVSNWLDDEEAYRDKYRDYLRPWRTLIAWFKEQEEFAQTAFVCIGDRRNFDSADVTFPTGTVLTPASLPRMAVGLTHKGSLCGLFGISVQT